MNCYIIAIGADLLDITGKHAIDHDNNLKEIPTNFKLTSEEHIQMVAARQKAQFLRHRYHSMHESIWDGGYFSESDRLPAT